MSLPYLAVHSLTKKYGGRTVLDIDNLAVARGEILAVIGSNGSGKSTLLRAIAHLERADTGRIRFGSDAKIQNDLAVRRKMAMVFQEPLLFSGTVFDNIAYGLKARKIQQKVIEEKVYSVAELLGIAHLLTRRSNHLSGGEAQRVSLARALVLEPELLLLDEPMASLDPPTKESLIADLHRILDEFDMTVVYVTHDLTEAAILADRWVVMDGGRIVQEGTPREVMSQPANKKIADFVGVENIIEGSYCGSSDGIARVKVGESEIEVVGQGAIDGKIWVLIRPENVTIATAKPTQKTSVRNCFAGTVEKIFDLGMLHRVVVDCGFPLFAFVTKQSVEEMGLRIGDTVWASFKATGVHVVSRELERV